MHGLLQSLFNGLVRLDMDLHTCYIIVYIMLMNNTYSRSILIKQDILLCSVPVSILLHLVRTGFSKELFCVNVNNPLHTLPLSRAHTHEGVIEIHHSLAITEYMYLEKCAMYVLVHVMHANTVHSRLTMLGLCIPDYTSLTVLAANTYSGSLSLR